MKILVINAGSSSLKYQLIDMNGEKLLAKGLVDRIGLTDSNFKHKVEGREDYKHVFAEGLKDHASAISLVIDTLVDPVLGVISSMKEIDAVGHRVLHGGEKFSGSVAVDDAVKAAIDECKVFGPLHNPANLTGILACEEVMPDVPQVAVFDTGFHQTMPDYAYIYPIPYHYYEKYGIRRYGFHGTSHRFVSAEAIKMLGFKSAEGTKIVTCHLGNGSSISAVQDGKCFDTTMGLTPLEGIIMGTRCGSIDPAIIPFIMNKEGLTADQIDKLMNKQSGILGVTEGLKIEKDGVEIDGQTSDNRTIENGAKEGIERYRLVESILCHQLVKYIGGFAAAMGGLDAVVFCGGIGENNPQYRTRVAGKLKFLGVEIDEALNAKASHTDVAYDISTPDAKVRMLIIPTNEELMIARDTEAIVKGL